MSFRFLPDKLAQAKLRDIGAERHLAADEIAQNRTFETVSQRRTRFRQE